MPSCVICITFREDADQFSADPYSKLVMKYAGDVGELQEREDSKASLD